VDKARLDEFERRCIQEEPPECVAACPLHVDARALCIEVARGAWPDAWKVLRKTMPLPSVLGRICDHPCEPRCKRRERGDAIRVGALERAVVQTPQPAGKTLPMPRRDKRVAIIGSGLTGLTAASDLARKGYPVTVVDPAERLGGPLLQFPASRLPPEAIAHEIEVMQKLGVKFLPGAEVDLAALRSSFDAVLWTADTAVEGPEGEVEVYSVLGTDGEQTGLFVVPDSGLSAVEWAADGRSAATSVDRYLQGASLSVGREKEGPQPTRLFVSLAGIEPSVTVQPVDRAAGYSAEEARHEADRCLRCECLECVKVCEYLRQFGEYPRRHARKIYNDASMLQGEHKSNLLANSCMLCDLCTTVCPEDFSMPDLCLGARQEMVERGKMPPSAHEFALEDYAWSHGDQFALTRSDPGCERSAYVLFPGCQLAGSNPVQVEALYDHLRKNLPGGVGLMLDCCGAPPFWAGRQDIFEGGVTDITLAWEELGSPQVIFACPTCLALLGPRLEKARCWSLPEILETLPLPAAPGVGGRPTRALHDPCTTRHAPLVQASVRRLLAAVGQPVQELTLSGELTECCGYGGLEGNANPALARDVAARRAAESDAEFVTYCAMCRDRLASVGKRTIHVLDLLFPGGDDPAARARPGWSERRENRARLKERLVATLWSEGAEAVEPWESVRLHIPDEVAGRLDARRILVEDVQRVIHHAEQTGEKLCDPGSGRFLACYRPRSVTFWVEYSSHGGSFEVHNAYGHRMTARLEAQ
jgi:glutamate synthase (NADPH) small chain